MNEEITAKIASQPLKAIDMLLDLAADRRSWAAEKVEPLVELLAIAVMNAAGGSIGEGGTGRSAMFRDDASGGVRRLGAAVLLRLLARCREAFEDLNFRIEALRLLDTSISSDVYPLLSVSERDMAVDKLNKLQDAAPRAEAELGAVIEALASLDSLERFRQDFFARTRRPLVRTIVLPFLDPQLLEPVRVGTLLEAAIAYRDANSPRLLDSYHTLHEQLDSFRADAGSIGTRYAGVYLVSLADTLAKLVDVRFKAGPLSRPATLRVEAFNKKYALQEDGLEIEIRLVIANEGPGPAEETVLYLDGYENIEPLDKAVIIGSISERHREVVVPCRVISSDVMAMLRGRVAWQNVDRSLGDAPFEVLLEAHAREVDWSALASMDPYSLEPVPDERGLADRREALRDLIARSTARSIGSTVIYGQRRVGKTSLARALQAHLTETEGADYKVIYLEAGAFRNPDPFTTIAELGRRICLELKRSDRRLTQLKIPEFRGALALLDEFLLVASDAIPTLRALFVLDEFDELGPELARRGVVSDPLYVSIRTISGRDPFGFILVGGENMEVVRQEHGDRLNKFEYLRLDYFDRATQWEDYSELIRQPVDGVVEYSEDAVHALYEVTSGHPYFSKAASHEVLQGVLARHDPDVTVREVEQAISRTVRKRESNTFQHFWTDGLLDVPERVRAASAVRRQVLVSLARVLRKVEAPTADAIAREARALGLSAEQVRVELDDFVRRQVLVSDDQTGYRCKVPLFQDWLVERGVEQIASTFEDRKIIGLIESEDERLRVKPEEIVELISGWDLYRGQQITEGAVRLWLNQFNGAREQRLMFKLLKGINFISAARIGVQLRDVHRQRVLKDVRGLVTGERKRSDILVSHLGGPGKSGTQYARIYAQEARIYIETNVVTSTAIPRVLQERGKHLQRLVFVDDLIGSGSQAAKNLRRLAEESGEALLRDDLKCFYIVLCAFEEGLHRVHSAIEELSLPLDVVLCEPLLGDSDRAFSAEATLFEDPQEASEAKRVAWDRGQAIAKDYPLGFGDSEALLVFAYSVPNNTLPILWGASESWRPLFPR